MLAQLLNRPCTILRRSESGSEDDYGNEIPDEQQVETVCELQQRSRQEPGNEGELSDTSWLAIFPAGTELDTGDGLLVDDQKYEMVGDPWIARNPRTRAVSHVEATLRRTESEAAGS